MLTLHSAHAVPDVSGDLDLDLHLTDGQTLHIRVPMSKRSMLGDVLLFGLASFDNPRQHGGQVKAKETKGKGYLPSGELLVSASGWKLWKNNPTLTVKAVAQIMETSPKTMKAHFIRFHGEDYKRIASETGRGNGRAINQTSIRKGHA
jgi:hypothetical protein